jgi:uncharacterized protein YaaQ
MLAFAIECPVATYGRTGCTGGFLPTPLTLLRGVSDKELKQLQQAIAQREKCSHSSIHRITVVI